jgi:hypothetical protein
MNEAKSLMMDLWQAGIRPHGYVDPTPASEEVLHTLKAHLEDMRHIALAFVDTQVELKK